MTGLATFDSTLQKTNEWLKDIMDEMGTADRNRAFLALRAVLHMLRDRLTVEEAAEFAAQLPMLIKGVYYEGWKPASVPNKARHKDEFLATILDYFTNEPDVDPEQITRAVFSVFEKRITSGEITDIRRMFPKELRDLWPAPTPSV